MDYALHLQSLSKDYSGSSSKALSSLTLSVRTGSMFGLIGANGAGKSTLIYTIAGLVNRTSGKMFCFGEEVKETDYEYRRRIGFVLDKPMYFHKLTAKEYLGFVAGMFDIPKRVARQKVTELLDFFDLEAVANRRIATYSKGMKQKVTFAAAIIHEPDLLILDEPFDGIDVHSTESIKTLLRQMNERGVTIILTSHVLELVEELCTDIAIIHGGEIVFQSATADLQERLRDTDDTRSGTPLRDVFLTITSPDRPHKTLSWLE